MLVSLIGARDSEQVAEVAITCGSDIDLPAELKRPWTRIWVARTEGGRIAGFLLVWLVADEVHIIHVATHPSERRRGVASALLREVLGAAKSQPARLVLLEVRRSNHAAIRLYRTHGFHAIGLRRGYYAENSEDAIEMVLVIDPLTGQVLPGKDQIDLSA